MQALYRTSQVSWTQLLYLGTRGGGGGGVVVGEGENSKQTPHWAQSPTWGLISQPWDHDLSWNQESDSQPTESPIHIPLWLSFKSRKFKQTESWYSKTPYFPYRFPGFHSLSKHLCASSSSKHWEYNENRSTWFLSLNIHCLDFQAFRRISYLVII